LEVISKNLGGDQDLSLFYNFVVFSPSAPLWFPLLCLIVHLHLVGYMLYSLQDWSHVLSSDMGALWGLGWGRGGDIKGFRGEAPETFFFGKFLRPFFAAFWHTVFIDGFLILVKELGLLTNPGQWIRGLDSIGYIVL
jgi:hypothetical protein